jgi:hypothetical protein
MNSNLVKTFCKCIDELTGITLFPDQVKVEDSSSSLSIFVFGFPLLELHDPEGTMRDEEGIMEACMNTPHLSDRLIRNKIREFENNLMPHFGKIRSILETAFQQDELEMMEFEVVNLDYPRHHWETSKEAERGFPELAFRICDFDEFEWFYLLNTMADDFDADIVEPLYQRLRLFISESQ